MPSLSTISASQLLRVHSLIAALTLTLLADSNTERLEDQPLNQLKSRRELIENELSQLASYSLRSGVGVIGYRSQANEAENEEETIEINLEKETSIDSIILVPNISRDTQTGFRADGFPKEFSIVAGTKKDSIGRVIATYNSNFGATTRIAPLIIPCNGITASWIRLEATLLTPRAFDGKFVLQLSEIMVFTGEENIALGKGVLTSSKPISNTPAWNRKYLVDGSLPYLMDAAHGNQSVSFVSSNIAQTASISIDLKASHLLTQINLHTVDQSDTVPQAYAGDFGFPHHFTVEGSNEADFSDARLLLDYRRERTLDISPIVPLNLIQAKCRYVRLTAVEPYTYEGIGENGERVVSNRLGFAEIELFSNNRNVALGKTAFSVHYPDYPVRSVAALTDGNNLYGEILPFREWMRQLSLRHNLELELPLIETELDRRYERQKANLRILSWIIAALLVGSIILVLVDRFLRQRAIFKTKERIAADLHDELGANLYAIALLGDLAQASKNSPEKSGKHLERIRTLIRRTSEAAKNCTNMLDTPGLYEDLIGEMKRSARRITADLKHDLAFENEPLIERIKPRKRIDLFLFFNECLVNIIRHSDATDVKSRLSANAQSVTLTVGDNGKGLNNVPKISVPPSLKRRARLIGAQVFASNLEHGGTLITLHMKLK
jgi:signal transduction histidine kinase